MMTFPAQLRFFIQRYDAAVTSVMRECESKISEVPLSKADFTSALAEKIRDYTPK